MVKHFTVKPSLTAATEVRTYQNKKNPNKYLEEHNDGHGHRSLKQYMAWTTEDGPVVNPTGDGNLHRWRKANRDELLEDYIDITDDEPVDEFGNPVPQDLNPEVYGSSEVDSWEKGFNPELQHTFYQLNTPSGVANIHYEDNDGDGSYQVRVDTNSGDVADNSFKSLDEAKEFAEGILLPDVIASTEIEGDTGYDANDFSWMEGLYWDQDGHTMTVTQVDSQLSTAIITEQWISEDTWEDKSDEDLYIILKDDGGHIYFQNKEYPKYKLYAQNAFNYRSKVPHDQDELAFLDDDDEDDYPEYEEEDYRSATMRDYGPSNPWDAPGMSIRDFI